MDPIVNPTIDEFYARPDQDIPVYRVPESVDIDLQLKGDRRSRSNRKRPRKDTNLNRSQGVGVECCHIEASDCQDNQEQKSDAVVTHERDTKKPSNNGDGLVDNFTENRMAEEEEIINARNEKESRRKKQHKKQDKRLHTEHTKLYGGKRVHEKQQVASSRSEQKALHNTEQKYWHIRSPVVDNPISEQFTFTESGRTPTVIRGTNLMVFAKTTDPSLGRQKRSNNQAHYTVKHGVTAPYVDENYLEMDNSVVAINQTVNSPRQNSISSSLEIGGKLNKEQLKRLGTVGLFREDRIQHYNILRPGGTGGFLENLNCATIQQRLDWLADGMTSMVIYCLLLYAGLVMIVLLTDKPMVFKPLFRTR